VEGTLALESCSLHVAEGEFVAVVGPSGCGKSTLMRLVSGLWPATDGNVLVANREVDGPLDLVGMAFQNPTLLPWRSILDNVMLPAEIIGLPRRASRERARDLLAMVGLAGYEDKYPQQLSGGMQQRCAIARALVHDPKLILADEPFGALDAITREQMQLELQRIWRQSRKTIVFVTHDVEEAVILADHIVMLSPRPGRVHAETTVTLPHPRLGTPQAQALVADLRAAIAGLSSDWVI